MFGVVLPAEVEPVASFQKGRNVALGCLGVIYGFFEDIDIRTWEIRIPGILTAKHDENLDDEKRCGACTRLVCSIALGTPKGGVKSASSFFDVGPRCSDRELRDPRSETSPPEKG